MVFHFDQFQGKSQRRFDSAPGYGPGGQASVRGLGGAQLVSGAVGAGRLCQACVRKQVHWMDLASEQEDLEDDYCCSMNLVIQCLRVEKHVPHCPAMRERSETDRLLGQMSSVFNHNFAPFVLLVHTWLKCGEEAQA